MTPDPGTIGADASALSALRDIHLPDPVGFWPLAPGWWIVAALLFTLGLWLFLRARARANSPERQALRLLDTMRARYERDADPAALAVGLSELLRRLALARDARVEVAALHGTARAAAWSGPDGGAESPFALIAEIEAHVYAGPERAAGAADPRDWIEGVRRLIRRKS